MYVHVYGGQRTTLGIILQVQCPLATRDRGSAMVWSSLRGLDLAWSVISKHPPFSALLCMHHHPVSDFWCFVCSDTEAQGFSF